MFKKDIKKMIVAIGLAVALLSQTGLGYSYPATLFWQGSMIQATPFDNKIVRSGILNQIFPVSRNDTAESLFTIARSFRYIPDRRGKDIWQTPVETETRRAGDCEDKAIWLFVQLKKSGYDQVRLIIGRMKPSSRGFHVWITLAGEADQLLILDPTAQKRIWNASDFSASEYIPLYSFDGINRYRHDS